MWALQRLQKLVDEMLLLARLDAGANRRSDEINDVVGTIRGIVIEFSSGFYRQGPVALRRAPAAALPPVRISPMHWSSGSRST